MRNLGNYEYLCIDSKDHIFSVLDAAFEELKNITQNEQFKSFQSNVIKLREQLNNMDITPFFSDEKRDETYLKGIKLDKGTFGISLLPRPIGFKTIIWENENYDPQKLADMLNAHPEIKEEFSQLYKRDNRFWEHPGIIPFDSIIDWLNKLFIFLKGIQ